MEKNRSSPPPFLFPWVSPLVIKFVVISGGFEVQLYRNNRLLKNWQPSVLSHALPEPLIDWIDDHHINVAPQPYPLIKQLWQKLTPLASKKVVIESSVLAELEEVSPPQDFALVWALNRSLERIEGHYEGVDCYLGMGWFQKGRKVWSLNNNPSNPIYSQFENLIVAIQQAAFLRSSIIPYLQHHLPTRADFQFITNFALQVMVLDVQSGGLMLALQCNYPQFLPTIQIPQQKIDLLLANQAIIRFPHRALTPAIIQLLQKGSSIIIQEADIPLFISEQLPIMQHYHQISDDMAAKITQFAVQPNPETERKPEQTHVQPNTNIPARPVYDSARPTPVPAPILGTIELNQQKIVKLHQESEELQERLTVEAEEGREQSQFTLGTTAVSETSAGSIGLLNPKPSYQNVGNGPARHVMRTQFVKPGFIDARYKVLKNLDAIAPPVQLNQEAILKLQEESEQLQERLLVETEEEHEQFPIVLMAETVPVIPTVNAVTNSALEVDEDWMIILQRWQPEHWEVILLLYEEQYTQLTVVERKVHRPVPLLIDEINLPVDEQLGDLLVDPDTRTISNHLHATAESLIRWYLSSNGR